MRHQNVLREVAPLALWLVLAFLVIDGVSMIWSGSQQLQPARDLAREGTVTTARESLVYVRSGRGLHVANVRVRLDVRPQLVYLSDIQPPETPLDDGDLPPAIGWQPATLLTGYVAPFSVRYLRAADGTIIAMAESDIAQQGSYAPIVRGSVMAAVAVLGAGVALLVLRRRGRRSRRGFDLTGDHRR